MSQNGNNLRNGMVKVRHLAIAFCCVVSACMPAPGASASPSSRMAIRTASQDDSSLEITPEKISTDLIGHVIEIPTDKGDRQPAQWTFEADEFRQIEIIDRKVTPTTAMITIFMTTHDNPEGPEDALAVSGTVRLSYQRTGAEWILTKTENITFRAIEGISI